MNDETRFAVGDTVMLKPESFWVSAGGYGSTWRGTVLTQEDYLGTLEIREHNDNETRYIHVDHLMRVPPEGEEDGYGVNVPRPEILTVEYRRLVSGDNFTNETIGVTAKVQPDEAPEAVLADLKQWVDHQLGVQPSTPPAPDVNALADAVAQVLSERLARMALPF